MNIKKKSFYFKYIQKINTVFNSIEIKKIEILEKLIKKSNRNKILIFGNGAGASIASHFANDLSNTSKIKTISFDNSAHLTCFANDYGYENWVARAIDFYADEGDVLILISSSGSSENMLNAADAARNNRMSSIITLSGFDSNNPLRSKGDINLWLDSRSYNYVENIHQIWLLSVVDMIIGKIEYPNTI